MTDETRARDAHEGVTGELLHDRRVGDQDVTEWSTPAGRAAARSATRASRTLGAHGTLAVILIIGMVAVFVLAFLVSRVYDAVAEHDGIASLDVPALRAATALRSPLTIGIADTVAYAFGRVGMPILAVIACALLALRRRSWTPVILVAAAGIGSLLMTIAGKDIIGRHRPLLSQAVPPFEYSPSFPSGHTLNATVIAGIVAYLLILRQRRVAARVLTIVVTVLIALVVGATRILLGAHWFTDVLAGWLLGAAWIAVVVTAHRLYLTTRRHELATEAGSPEAAAAASPIEATRVEAAASDAAPAVAVERRAHPQAEDPRRDRRD
jgi:undecaprenyl-diphosphatase